MVAKLGVGSSGTPLGGIGVLGGRRIAESSGPMASASTGRSDIGGLARALLFGLMMTSETGATGVCEVRGAAYARGAPAFRPSRPTSVEAKQNRARSEARRGVGQRGLCEIISAVSLFDFYGGYGPDKNGSNRECPGI